MHPLVTNVATFWQRVQTTLFPYLASVDLPLTPYLERLVLILEVLRVEEGVPRRGAHQPGAPPCDRGALARAFVVKAFLNLPGTEALRQRLQTDGPSPDMGESPGTPEDRGNRARRVGWGTPGGLRLATGAPRRKISGHGAPQ